MEKQYIGARYVPIIDGEWSANKKYDALTIVTYFNNSYTSKKPVPIGVLPTDENYWALTGNYNAQVEQYRQEVVEHERKIDAIEKELTYINDKKIIVIGDSYGTTMGDGETEITPYPVYLKEFLRYDDEHFISAHRNGAGFGNGRFLELLNSIENNSEIDEIYVFGGWNDIDSRYDREVVQSNMEVFSARAREKFPKAKLYLGMLCYGYELTTERVESFIVLNRTTYAQCVRYGFDGYLNTYGICVQQQATFWVNTETSQGKHHPSTLGSTFIGIRLASVINTKNVCFSYRNFATPIGENGITPSGFTLQQVNDGTHVTTIINGQMKLLHDSGFNLESDFGGEYLAVCSLSDNLSNGYGNYTTFYGVCRYHTVEHTDSWLVANVVLVYREKKLLIASTQNAIESITEMYINVKGVVTNTALYA